MGDLPNVYATAPLSVGSAGRRFKHIQAHTTQPYRFARIYKFVFDVLSAIPFDWIIVDSVSVAGGSYQVIAGLSFIKMIQLVRFYRVFEFFQQMDYMISLSQGTLLVVRNTTYAFYVTHWSACVLYLIANVEGFSPASWVGRNADRFMGRPKYERYLLSLYFSVSAFTGLGDGALFATTVPEAAFMIMYLLFNLFLGAYILGTVTMLVVKGDERSKAFRDRMHSLVEFSRNNDLPEPLQLAMQEHLEVTFRTDEASEEQVLGIYPTAIRRKVLRHLYLAPVRDCYLFKGCKQRFLDALLTAARVELFMPGVQIVTEGDHVSELLLIISGEVSVAQPKGSTIKAALTTQVVNMSMNAADGALSVRAMSGEPSTHGGGGGGGGGGSVRANSADTTRTLSGGDGHDLHFEGATLSEVPFFTDVPCYESAVSTTVVRVLSVTKAAWELLMEQFPQQARLVLSNLQKQQETELQNMLQAAATNCQLTSEQLDTALTLLKADEGLETVDPQMVADTRAALTQAQMDQLMRLDDIRSLVRAHVHKVDQMRTYNFLQQASLGDIEALRTMLNQGVSPSSADYDGRSGLMIAAAEGHEDVIRLLLDHGAQADQVDALGNSALSEACKAGNDKVIDLLLAYGASLNMDPMAVASIMCTAVYEGDLTKIRRLLKSGAPPDACDYDKRSALHIAGAEGNLAAVKLLVEEGGADPNFQDRWGNTALDEARRVGAKPVVAYLEGLSSADEVKLSDVKLKRRLQTDLFTSCQLGDVEKLAGLFANVRPPCLHTAMLLAASDGRMAIVEALNKYTHGMVLERVGHLALLDAAEVGRVNVVRGLRNLGVRLSDPRDTSLLAAVEVAVLRQDVKVVVALLEAGVLISPPGPSEATAAGPAAARRGPSMALHTAASSGNLEMVRVLVELGGASPVAVNSEGATPATVADRATLANAGSEKHRAVADYLRWAAGQGLRVGAEAAATKFGALAEVMSTQLEADAEPEGPMPSAPSASGQSDSTQSGQGGLVPSGSSLRRFASVLKSVKTNGTGGFDPDFALGSVAGRELSGQSLAAHHTGEGNGRSNSILVPHGAHSRLYVDHTNRISTLRMLAQAPASAEIASPAGMSRLGSQPSIRSNGDRRTSVDQPRLSQRLSTSGQQIAALSQQPTTTTPTTKALTPRATASTSSSDAADKLTFRVPSPDLAAAASPGVQGAPSPDGAPASPTGGGQQQQQQIRPPRPTLMTGAYVTALGQTAAVVTGAISAGGAGGGSVGPGKRTPAAPSPLGLRLSLPEPDPAAAPTPQQEADMLLASINLDKNDGRGGGGAAGGGGGGTATQPKVPAHELPGTVQSTAASVRPPTASGRLATSSSGARPPTAAAGVVARLELPRPATASNGDGGGGGSGSAAAAAATGGSGSGLAGSQGSRVGTPMGRPGSIAAPAQAARMSSQGGAPGAAPPGAGPSAAVDSPRGIPPWRVSAAGAAAAGSAGASAAASPRGAPSGAMSTTPSALAVVQPVAGDGGDGGGGENGRRRSITEEALSELSPPPAVAAARSVAKLGMDKLEEGAE